MNYRFKSLKSIGQLPYFEIKDQVIKLKPGLIDYKIIDFHSHLGWNYPIGKRIDMWKKGKVNYIYPETGDFDLTRHGALDLGNKLNHKETEIINGIFYLKKYSLTYTFPNFLSEMDNFDIDQSVILCLKLPFMANNTTHILKNVNKDNEIKRRLIIFAAISPSTPLKAIKMKNWVKLGVKGIKLHPLFNFFVPSHHRCYRIYSLAEKYNLPILFHTGLSPAAPSYLKHYVQINHYEQAIKDFPKVTFILGHGGGYSDVDGALNLAKKYSNTYLETSGQPPITIKRFINEVGANRVLYGSDWPFYPTIISLAKVLIATDNNPKARQLILHDNAKNILK